MFKQKFLCQKFFKINQDEDNFLETHASKLYNIQIFKNKNTKNTFFHNWKKNNKKYSYPNGGNSSENKIFSTFIS